MLNELWDEMQKNPRDAKILVRIGALLFTSLHREEEALSYLQMALETDPTNVEALFWSAKIYIHYYMDDEKAEQLLQRAIEIDPGRADCLSLMTSVILDTVVDPYEANRRVLQYVQKAIEREPSWPMLWLIGANALRQLGMKERSMAYSRKGLILAGTFSPDDPIAFYYEEVETGRASKSVIAELTRLSN